MRNFITNSTAFYKAGISPGKKIFRINSGPYAGRLAMLMATSANNIQITYADYPYNVWAVPETMIYDSADYPFDAVMNSTGDIYLAYTLESSHALVLRKLTFSLGGWHAGTLRTIYNVSGCYFPSILIESPEKLWVSYTRQSDSQFIVNAKSSEDDGETWMGGPEDFGWLMTALIQGLSFSGRFSTRFILSTDPNWLCEENTSRRPSGILSRKLPAEPDLTAISMSRFQKMAAWESFSTTAS